MLPAVSSRFDAGISSGVSVSTKVYPASPVFPSQLSYPCDGEARGENGRLPVLYKNISSMLHAGKMFPSIHIRMKIRSCVPNGSTVMAAGGRPLHVYKNFSPSPLALIIAYTRLSLRGIALRLSHLQASYSLSSHLSFFRPPA